MEQSDCYPTLPDGDGQLLGDVTEGMALPTCGGSFAFRFGTNSLKDVKDEQI